MIKTRKIGIIGTGHVGAHVAFSLATQGEVDELILIDKNQDKAHAQALDLMDATSYYPHHLLAKSGTYSDLKNADILVISAGPLPDMYQDRLDTLSDTITVLKEILPQIKASGFSGIILTISNPADVVATYIQNFLNYPKNKILSTGCVLDSARLQSRLSQSLNVNRNSLIAYCMGEHGSSAMVSWSNVFVGALPLASFLKLKKITSFNTEQLLSETKEGGYLVLRGKGSTEFGIAASLVEIVRCIFHNEHKVLPASVYLNGEYNQQGIFASVPTIIGKSGVEQILEIKLTQEEHAEFTHSCSIIKQNYEKALAL